MNILKIIAHLNGARVFNPASTLPKAGLKTRAPLRRLGTAALQLAAFTAFAQHPVMDGGFDEHGLKIIGFDEGAEEVVIIHPDMTGYDSARRGIPDAVMKQSGYPLDLDTRATMLGGISLRDRYRWNLSITDESTSGDGISDWVKMRPPGWIEARPRSPVYFTMAEGVADATPSEEGDYVFIPNLADYEKTWDENAMDIPLGDFRFPLGKSYQPGPFRISNLGTLEFGNAQRNGQSRKLPTAELSGDAVAVAWDTWGPVKPNPNTQIVAGFRGEQRGQRYFFTRWEKMRYRRLNNMPFVTFEGRLYEDGRVEFHYLEGDFSPDSNFSGAQCWRGYYGLTVPQEKMVAGTKITFTPHYQMDPRSSNMLKDGVPDAWKVMFKINPHCENAANMVFNDKGLTLKQCFEKRLDPWTGLPRAPQ